MYDGERRLRELELLCGRLEAECERLERENRELGEQVDFLRTIVGEVHKDRALARLLRGLPRLSPGG